MNDVRLSVATKRLLAAAKADVPSATARAKVWAGVSTSVGAAAGVSASIVMTGGTGGAKVFTLGGLFGGALTVGLAATLLTIAPVPDALPHALAPSPAPAMAQASFVSPAPPAARESVPKGSRAPSPSTPSKLGPAAPSLSPARSPSRHKKPATTPAEDSLAREASLVAEARGALGRGDPESALRAIRAARALRSRQLVPEELAVEMQALRAHGESDQANGIDVQLRLQYPDSALAR